MGQQETVDEAIRQAKRVYLYGAGIIAYGIREALRECYGVQIVAHIVTRRTSEETTYVGVPLQAVTKLPAHLPDARGAIRRRCHHHGVGRRRRPATAVPLRWRRVVPIPALRFRRGPCALASPDLWLV